MKPLLEQEYLYKIQVCKGHAKRYYDSGDYENASSECLRCSKYCEVLAKRTEDENKKRVYCEASEKFANTSMMGLSIIEDQTISELRRLKDQWKRVYEEGKDKDKDGQRVLLHQMKHIEGEVAKKDMELAKIIEMKDLDEIMEAMIDQLPDEEVSMIWGIWGDEIETKDLDEILNRKIEEEKTILEV